MCALSASNVKGHWSQASALRPRCNWCVITASLSSIRCIISVTNSSVCQCRNNFRIVVDAFKVAGTNGSHCRKAFTKESLEPVELYSGQFITGAASGTADSENKDRLRNNICVPTISGKSVIEISLLPRLYTALHSVCYHGCTQLYIQFLRACSKGILPPSPK